MVKNEKGGLIKMNKLQELKQKLKFEEKNDIKVSEFNLLTFFLSSLAILGMLVIFYITKDKEPVWARYSLLMFFFGITGLIALNYYNNKRLEYMNLYYRKVNTDNVFYAFLVYAALLLIQILMGLLEAYLAPANIIEIAYTVFSSVCEELFYRGLILGFFIWLAKGKNKSLMVSGLLISVGIVVSAVAFALSHTNYYNKPLLLIAVGLSGMILGLSYIWKKDIMIPMVAHFLLNCTVVGQQIIGGVF